MDQRRIRLERQLSFKQQVAQDKDGINDDVSAVEEKKIEQSQTWVEEKLQQSERMQEALA